MGTDLVANATFDETARFAKALAQCGFYKDIKTAAEAMVKLTIAREMGLGIRGISDVHIVEGKPTLAYQLILSRVRMFTGPFGTDRYDYRYLRRDEECVEIEWRINNEVVGVSRCNTDDAKRMGVEGKMNWRKYPRQMRTARAVTEGVNAFMPEVIGGAIYTPEELGDDNPEKNFAVQVGEPTIVVTPQIVDTPNQQVVDDEGGGMIFDAQIVEGAEPE